MRLGWAALCLVIAVLLGTTVQRCGWQRPAQDTTELHRLRELLRAQASAAHRADSIGRLNLDSLRARLALADSAQVARIAWRTIRTHDTIHDTTRLPGVVQIIREGADSLATCRKDRDSLGRALGLQTTRTAMSDEGKRLSEERPPVAHDEPSRTAWFLGGAGALAVVEILTLVFLGGI